MNSIDQLELDVIEYSGDIALAEQVGQIARWAVDTVTQAAAAIIGIDPDTLVIDYNVLAGHA